ncbi:hypothetical protein EJ065_1174 [Corallococcus coralloides]|uniref:Uncharacterized protein n=1 Tax=Corallococcus coralloides TaxID=184914 RepID=A0A410RLY0_CORCK|nr:hypothetical protein EJ065_1174 [Corallococcus coralloides]
MFSLRSPLLFVLAVLFFPAVLAGTLVLDLVPAPVPQR